MMVLNSSLFCPNGQFLNKVTNYLCSNSLGLFTPCSVALLKDIYGQMRNNINTPFIGSNFGKRIKVQIYPLGQACLNGSIDQTNIIANGKLSCGHDLPVWLNNPETAKHRIMVLSQDPRRNKYEMGNMEIGVSSPFGLHSIIWRSSKLTGLIHHVSKRLIDDYKDNVSIYYTDILKLRKTDSTVMDTKNMKVYHDILAKEIELFKPTLFLLLGSQAQKGITSIALQHPVVQVSVPHPNARIINGEWGEFTSNGKYDAQWKSDTILDEIRKVLP